MATLLTGVLLAIVVAAIPRTALAQTPTSAAQTSTPTAVAPPPAPSGVQIHGDLISWQDNSNNEDGFRIRYSIGAPDDFVQYETGANVVIFQLPPSAPRLQGCAGTLTISVRAFNSGGESSSGDAHVTFECPLQVPTPPPVQLPPTGAGSTSLPARALPPAVAILLLVALALLVASGALRAQRSRRP